MQSDKEIHTFRLIVATASVIALYLLGKHCGSASVILIDW